jgi:hypothetical protein
MTGIPDTIDADIRGDVSGQIAVGKHIFQVQTLQLTNHGGIVNLGPVAEAPRPKPRATPAPFRFRPFPDLLDRTSELQSAIAALGQQATVELSGEPGIGKSALLRHLAQAPSLPVLPDGIVCLGQSLVAGRSVDDLLQTLFDAFYECPNPYKPSAAELRLALGSKRFLLFVDDSELDRNDLSALLDAAPSCLVVLTGAAPRLLGESRAVTLQGLSIDDALRLLERGLGRPIRDDEQQAARELCEALAGHPLRILQAAAMMRDEQSNAGAMLQRMRAAGPVSTPATLAMAALRPDERRVLSALSTPAGIRLTADMIGPITGIELPHATLDGLVARGLIESDAGGYRLAGGFSPYELGALTSGAEPRETLSQITQWAKHESRSMSEVQANGDAILYMLEWAVGAAMWGSALELARAAEAPFAVAGAWGAWSRVLGYELQAARALGDTAAEAWARHQIGTRALALDDLAGAQASLQSALDLRETLGDDAGAAVTRHNLQLALGAPATVVEEHVEHGGTPSVKLLAAAAGIVGVGALALWQFAAPPAPPTVTPTAPLVRSATPLPLIVDPTATSRALGPATTTTALTAPITATPSPTQARTSTPTSPPEAVLPDLSVQTIELAGRPSIGIAPGLSQRAESWLVPVRIAIHNLGSASAAIFKVSAVYAEQVGASDRGTFQAPFIVAGQRTPGYAFTASPLGAAETVSFSGSIVLPLALTGRSVALRVIADSCAGDERLPPFCRVQEQREENNTSTALQVQLPPAPATATRTRTPTRAPPTRTPTRVVVIN